MHKYLIVFILAISLIIFAGCRPSEGPAVQQPTADKDITEIEAHEPGQVVATGDIVWEVLEVEDLGVQLTHERFPGILEAEAGRFIGITFFVQNTGDDPKVIFDLTAIDDTGRTYSICLAAFAFFNNQDACVLQEIIPGIENTFNAVFDVEVDADRLLLKITDLEIPAGEAAYIDLGIQDL